MKSWQHFSDLLSFFPGKIFLAKFKKVLVKSLVPILSQGGYMCLYHCWVCQSCFFRQSTIFENDTVSKKSAIPVLCLFHTPISLATAGSKLKLSL